MKTGNPSSPQGIVKRGNFNTPNSDPIHLNGVHNPFAGDLVDHRSPFPRAVSLRNNNPLPDLPSIYHTARVFTSPARTHWGRWTKVWRLALAEKSVTSPKREARAFSETAASYLQREMEDSEVDWVCVVEKSECLQREMEDSSAREEEMGFSFEP
ncbi:hypothetical protein DEO72_LG9g2501 [Vigna unguiculata]|uniref:Uncharacterized protein n=1 Tax=Vigna unguiculata TaxID=3917 RepID=A0A4D6N3P3_VIGUN|nr:hypothetical protein DEO72_LG9g2500 [Vigna unguiculata]QCE07481.1 hypothetical protein DEO72_LG9g2501 [Vigna unguiculata]